MNWGFLIWFGIGLAVYLSVIGIVALIKYIKSKKQYKKELTKVSNDGEKQDNVSNA